MRTSAPARRRDGEASSSRGPCPLVDVYAADSDLTRADIRVERSTISNQCIEPATTARAREAAEQFAHDSTSEIGGIRQASQRVFEILPRDQAPGISAESQVVKTVRVVSTIDYPLRY